MNLSTSILRLISDRPLNRKDLLKMLHGYGFNISDREMRDHIHHMITDEGYCIQSSSKGYQLITSQEQLEGAVRYIDSYIRESAERKRMLIENYEKQRSGLVQLEMFK